MKMKISIFFVFLLSLLNTVRAQELIVNGVVNDKSGSPVSKAYVQDKTDKVAVRTDSAGRFTLKASPNAVLLVAAADYDSRVIDVKNKSNLLIVLESKKDFSETPVQSPSLFSDYNASNGAASAVVYGGRSSSILPVFHPVGDTRGSRYLFKDWATGFVVSPLDSVYKNPDFGFNYDKMEGGLLLTQDKKTVVEIDKDKIKSFTLYNAIGQPSVYEYVPEIDKTRFPQLLSKGDKYKIYKLTTTTFVKANFRTDGMTSSGNNYDEFVDEDSYFVLDVKSKTVQPLSLKKKSIKTAFAADGSKLNTFFDAYPEKIDDSYLKKLGDFLNQ